MAGNVLPDQHTLILDRQTPEAETAPKQARAGMGDEEFQGFIFREAAMAKDYVDQHLIIARERATNYYHGRLPDVDLEDSGEDRSRAVVTDVRDAVLGLMPDLMRIFFGPGGVVEYKPVAVADPQRFAANQAQAKLATQYVRDVVLDVDNPDYFMTCHDVFKDAAVRKTGFIRWYWEEYKKPEYGHFTGLTEDMVSLIAAEDGIDIVDKAPHLQPDATMGSPAVLYDVTVKRVRADGRVKIAGVPCENMIVSAGARSVDDATLFGYTDELDAGEFIALGLVDSLDDLDGCDYDPADRENPQTTARRPGGVSILGINDDNPPEDKSRRKVKYGELFVRCDRDGDGIAELWHVHTAGTRFKVLQAEPCDDIDFAAFCCYPEAFEFWGESVADLTMDTQRISSRILRDTLDSLAQSVKPQMGVVEGQVNLDDVLNPDTSNVIRQRAPNMIQPITIPFVGKEALPVLDLIGQMRQNRTGISDATAGLDPKTFQSTDNDAIQNTITKGEGRVEFIARMFIEAGFKRLYRGILRLICKHQTSQRVVELTGKPAIIDPHYWDADMHVKPTLPLGRGGQQAQLQTLGAINAKQEQLLQTLGPDNPFVTIQQYYNTLAKMTEIAGWHNVGDYFTDPASFAPEQLQAVKQAMLKAMQAAAGGGKSAGPDPQVEQAKIASNEKIQGGKIAAKQQEVAASLQMKRLEMQLDMEARIIEALIAHKGNMDAAHLDALISSAGQRIDATVQMIQHQTQLASDNANAEADRQHEAAMQANQPQPQPQGQ